MYKNVRLWPAIEEALVVSILVLMELCIKTPNHNTNMIGLKGFNPCFNGTMYKNPYSF